MKGYGRQGSMELRWTRWRALRHWVDDIDVEVLLGELAAAARRTATTSQVAGPESSW